MVNCVISVFYPHAKQTHLLDYGIQIIYRVKHQPLFGKEKKWWSVLVRGVFLFDSLSYGDSAQGMGLKGRQPAVFGAAHLGPRWNSTGIN